MRRTTVCRSKEEGGLSVVNCLIKAQTIIVTSFLKCYTHDNYRNSLMLYFCHIRLNNILPSEYSIYHASLVSTPYYASIIHIIQSILHLPNFPYTPKDKIYQARLSDEKPMVETQYPTFNWKKIWSNYSSTFILAFDKEIIHKHLHMCLSTNNRLFMMNLTNSNKCEKCTSDREETPLHLFYECNNVKPVFLWVLRCLLTVCNFKPSSNIRFVYFDNKYINHSQKTICNTFIYIYIISIWRTRKENLRIGDMKKKILRKLNDYMSFIKLMPNHKFEKLSEDLSLLDNEILIDL